MTEERTYISLENVKDWIRELGYGKWDLYELSMGREAPILTHSGDDIDASVNRLEKVVLMGNDNTMYHIVVRKADAPNSTKYEKYFSIRGKSATAKEEKQPSNMGVMGLDSGMFQLLTQIGEIRGSSNAKESFMSYREQELIRKETLLEVREKELEIKFKQREKELKDDIKQLEEKYKSNTEAAKEGFSMAMVQGLKLFGGMGATQQTAIQGAETQYTEVQKQVLSLGKEKGWTDEEWKFIGNIIASVPQSIDVYFKILATIFQHAGQDKTLLNTIQSQLVEQYPKR